MKRQVPYTACAVAPAHQQVDGGDGQRSRSPKRERRATDGDIAEAEERGRSGSSSSAAASRSASSSSASSSARAPQQRVQQTDMATIRTKEDEELMRLLSFLEPLSRFRFFDEDGKSLRPASDNQIKAEHWVTTASEFFRELCRTGDDDTRYKAPVRVTEEVPEVCRPGESKHQVQKPSHEIGPGTHADCVSYESTYNSTLLIFFCPLILNTNKT